MFGYAGKIAFIDLTEGKVSVETLAEETARKYLGGKGLGAYLLYNRLKPGIDPYEPDNIILFLAGPLTGTDFPCAGRAAVVTKSPMTGTFLDSYAGGSFAACLRYAGFDGLMITGKASSPAFLVVDEGDVSIRDAASMWGLTTVESDARMRAAFAKKGKISIATIGPAGERLVRFANIMSEGRMFGRGGAGAVMGSKHLKSILVRGSAKVPVADAKALKNVITRVRNQISAHPMTKRGGIFPTMGTIMTVDLTQETGTLPTSNWRENTFSGARSINGHAFLEYATRPKACYRCPIGCSRMTKTTVAGVEYVNEGPEYETIYAFGSNCEISDPEVINGADRLCEEYGMDTISCGAVIGFAMECVEKALLSETEAGLQLTFGNKEAILPVVGLIGKREGIGRLLSEGVRRASAEIPGSSDFALHVKGLELPGYDPRGMKGQGLTYALSDRGACHVRSNTIRTELLGLPQPVDRFAYEGKARMIADLQLTYAMFDMLISCAFGGFAITEDDYVDALSAVTGWPFTKEELRTATERTWALTRLFNTREGFRRKDDTLPERLFKETSTRGPSRGHVVDRQAFEKMLEEYYKIVGWDPVTGIPTEKRLKELGI